jgi:glycosyltransferase (activator-dependent family)
MRVLFTTWSDRSIFQPMVPLAWALRTAGHEVRVASQPKLTEHVTQAGLTAVPVGRDSGFWRLTGLNTSRRESLRPGLPPPYDVVAGSGPVDAEAMRAGYRRIVAQWHKLDNFPMLAGLVDFARSWRPDLVIWEPTTYAGAIAARACGAASARLLWSVDVFGLTRERFRAVNGGGEDPLADWLGPYAERYGGEFSEDLVTGDFTIDPLPPSLRMPADLSYLPVRYLPYGGAAEVPAWLWAPPDRPRVALTLGTTATDNFAGYATDVQDILDALAGLDIELVATIVESEQRRLRVPANSRLVSYVPLHALAPTCAAVVNHGGPGTLLTTARYAVPQLLVPYDFDEPVLAARAAAQGAAATLPAAEATGPAVRDALARLLAGSSYQDSARRLRAEMAGMPSPNDVVAELEALTTKHR